MAKLPRALVRFDLPLALGDPTHPHPQTSPGYRAEPDQRRVAGPSGSMKRVGEMIQLGCLGQKLGGGEISAALIALGGRSR